MHLIQKAIDSLIAFKQAFDKSINSTLTADLATFDHMSKDLSGFDDWIEDSEKHYGDLRELKINLKHFQFFILKYAQYLKDKKTHEADMLKLAVDKAYKKLLFSLYDLQKTQSVA